MTAADLERLAAVTSQLNKAFVCFTIGATEAANRLSAETRRLTATLNKEKN